MQLAYDIKVVGMAAVEKAFASIERRVVQHNSRVTRTLSGGAGGGLSVAARHAAAPRSTAARVSDFSRGMDQIGRAARAADMKASRDAMRNEERQHQQKLRNIAKEEAARVRAEKRAAREAQRASHAQNRAAVQARRDFAGSTMGALKGAGSSLASVGRAGVGLVGIAGSMAAGVAINAEVRERAKASQLANQAGNPALKGQLLNDARGVRGFTGDEALGGMEAFVTKTGDLDTARKIIGDLGQLSLATGANLSDLGETAGQAFNVIRDQVQDPKKQLEELHDIMGALAQQGSLGAVEIKDLARDFGKLGAATRGFEGGSGKLLRTMGAFAQIAVARGGAEGSADASTASARLVGDIVTNKKKFAKLGIGIKSSLDPTKLRDPLAIMQDVLEKTGGDVEKTSGLFGIESAKIFKGLAATYSEAEKRKKGSGRSAVDAEFNRFASASLSDADIKSRAASRLDDPDLRFKEAMKSLNTAMSKDLLPVVTQLVGKMTELTPTIGLVTKRFSALVSWLAENPWKGLGVIVAGVLTKEIVSSGVPKLLKDLFGGGKDGGGGAGKIGGSGVLGAIQGGITVGTITAGLITAAGIKLFEDTDKRINESGRGVDATRGMNDKQLAAEVAKRKADIATREGNLGKLENAKDLATGGMGVLGNLAVGNPVGALISMFHNDVAKPELSSEIASKKSHLEEVEKVGGTGRGSIEEWAATVGETTAALSDFQKKLLGFSTGAPPNRGNAPTP